MVAIVKPTVKEIEEKKSKTTGLTVVSSTSNQEELAEKLMRVRLLESHALYIAPPRDVADSHRFGWLRGLALQTETLLTGRWYAWLQILHKGRLDDTDEMPRITYNSLGDHEAKKMLERCLKLVYAEGERVEALLEWIGYALGIAWFKEPKISDRLWTKLYHEFNLDMLIANPSDYFSHFLAENGASGLNGYYPTPLSVCQMMNNITDTAEVKPEYTRSVYEPCLGAAAMLLPSRSLNLVGTDINLLMIKASAIQAFLYQPSLLYTPYPVIGLHFCKKEMRINKYFEFETSTRIYWGDSLLGEFKAPKDIFSDSDESELMDIYLDPLDIQKREVLQFEDEMMRPWHSLSDELKLHIVKAQAREIGFDTVLSNPPFGAMNKYTMEQIREIEESNRRFLKGREQRLAASRLAAHPLIDTIQEKIELKLTEAKDGQFAFEF